MKNVDKMVLNNLRHFTEDERKELMLIFELTKYKPETKLVMAVFRDILIYKEMCNAYLLDMKLRVSELEAEVERLKKKKGY